MDEEQSPEEKEALMLLDKVAKELEKIQGANEKYLEVQRIAKEQEKKNLMCNFCGSKKSDVKFLIQGKSARICNNCIDLCYEMAKKEERNEQST